MMEEQHHFCSSEEIFCGSESAYREKAVEKKEAKKAEEKKAEKKEKQTS